MKKKKKTNKGEREKKKGKENTFSVISNEDKEWGSL